MEGAWFSDIPLFWNSRLGRPTATAIQAVIQPLWRRQRLPYWERLTEHTEQGLFGPHSRETAAYRQRRRFDVLALTEAAIFIQLYPRRVSRTNGLSGAIPALVVFEYQTDSIGGTMLWTIFVILLILWLLGFSLHVAGSLIHLLLVVAVVVLIINLVTGRRAA